jgi:glyoxylase-like metal-dependent hydrolase (beta-lactamase superfamily II)/rhodanese-related sulfurtransferase
VSVVDVVTLVEEGLGNNTHLLDLGDGRALVVDPSRDLRAVRTALEARGLRVAYVADTHLHADFLSGALELAASDGAQILASAAGGREFEHKGLGDGDEIDLGGLRLRALATPGHTYEHLAFQLLDGSRTAGVFTGGSMLVGSAARTDLIDPERTEGLTRLQFRSLQRIAMLDDEVAVWPTHGAGSFCSAPPGAARTSTVGTERATNALLRADGEEGFVAQLLSSLGTFPSYFHRLGEQNRRGPARLRNPPRPAALSPAEFRFARGHGAQVIDVRPVGAFAAGHVPGSLSIPLRPAFATWLGWLVEADANLLFVRDHDQDPEEIVGQAVKIGYDRIAGELVGGLASWGVEYEPLSRIPLVAPGAVGSAGVLDVRQDSEFAAGHLPGAQHVELGDLPAQAAQLPKVPTVVMCGHGERAMGAASVLARAGHRQLAVLAAGPEDWAQATGRLLECGA